MDFIKIIKNKLLPNCPLTCKDIMAAEHIFGPDLGLLECKTVRKQPPSTKIQNTHIPPSILHRYHKDILASDIMYVNKVSFFLSISHHIHFRTVQHLANQKATTILNTVKQAYSQHGYQLTHLLIDG